MDNDRPKPTLVVAPPKRPRGRPPKTPSQQAAAQVARVNRMQISREQIARGLAPQVVLGTKPRYDLAETQILLGISLYTVKKRIAAGELHALRDGDRVFVTDEEIRRYARTHREGAGE